MPIGFATENHETLLDVDHILHSLRSRHPEVTYVQMACVNDHPEFLRMAAQWADPQIEALLSQALSVNPQLAAVQAHHHDHDHGHHHHHGSHSHSAHSHHH
jgi:ferrochelatase